MRGTVYQRGKSKDRWTVKVDLPRGEDGKRRQKAFAFRGTKSEAEAYLAEKITEIERGLYVDPKRQILSDYLIDWLSSSESSLAVTTHERYDRLLIQHIIPHIGSVRMSKLTPQTVQGLYTKLAADGSRLDGKSGGLSAKTILQVHRILHKAFEVAMRWGILARNPADACMPPKLERSERSVLSAEDIGKLLKASLGGPYYLPILLAVSSGMRRGEILGLTWGDIDLEKGTVSVRRSLAQTSKGLSFKSPKSGRSRTLALPEFAVEALRKVAATEDQKLLVCRQSDGKPMKPDSFSSNWRSVRDTAKVNPEVTFHDLRHSHATLLLASGTHLKVLSSRLGHSTISITADTYAHCLPSMDEDAAKSLNVMLSPSDGRVEGADAEEQAETE